MNPTSATSPVRVEFQVVKDQIGVGTWRYSPVRIFVRVAIPRVPSVVVVLTLRVYIRVSSCQEFFPILTISLASVRPVGFSVTRRRPDT